MYKQSLPAWENAKSRQNEAHSTMERIYNQLDDPVLKDLFLLCGTTARWNRTTATWNRICLEDLFKYCMGLSLFENDHTVEHIRNAFYSKVKKLKDLCLLHFCLLDEANDTSIIMDDFVRDAARHIALRDHHMLSASEHGGVDQSDWKGWPNKDFTEKCTTISFPSARHIPEVLQCPALKMFLLQGDSKCNDSLKILPTFFEEMKQLKVLSLEDVHIPSLPSSLQLLKNLQTLCLHRCGLGDLSLVGQLNNLEILSFKGSDVEQLPKEIGQLTRLRLLDLSECYMLRVISPGVISSLERLEELRMRKSFRNWKAAGDGSNASLFELKHLSQLTALEVHVPDANILPADFLSHELKRFQIMIGDVWFWDDSTLNTLKLKLTASSFELDRGLKKVMFPNLSSLVVHGCNGLRFMLSSSTARSLIQLKHLKITECQMMEEIVSTEQHGEEITGNMFPQLQHLRLKGLPNLAKFCSASYIEFPSLKRLQLEKCAKLETLISHPLTKNIATDNKIEEEDSKENPETVVKYHLFDKKVSFPNLETLIMDGLPKLRTIWHNQLPPDSFCRLKDIVVQECKSLINIFAPSVMGRLNGLSTLSIKGCESLQVVFELEDIEVKDSYGRIYAATQLKYLYCQNLDSVNIYRCDNLTNIFPASVARDDRQLIQKLTVDDCGVLEEFVAKGEGLRTLVPKFLFPKLETVHASKWSLLKTLVFSDHGQVEIFSAEYSSFQKILELARLSTIKHSFLLIKEVVWSNLTSLIVHQRDELRFLLSSSTAKGLVQLKHLQVSKCEIMEEIILTRGYGEENMNNMFSKLENLELNNLPCLARFCSGSYIEFPSLERLQLEKCTKLESSFISYPLRKSIAIDKEIEERDMEENLETVVPYFLFDKKVWFPKLERLTINDLPKLTKIWGSQLSQNYSFYRLRDVTVQQCNSLKNIVPDSKTRVFQQLQKLTVENCGVLEGIVAQEEGETLMPDKFVLFPEVTCLELKSLPQLKRFYPRMHALNWPLLKKLELFDCRIVDIFASGFSGLPKTPCVLIEKSSFPNLEDLTLGPMDIWYGPPASAAFYEQAVFPGISSRHTDKTIPHLKKLRLHGMEKHMRLWENTDPAGPVFLQLETLEVKLCGLNNIELSAISFKNLTNLEVTFCWRLQYLTTYSVARSLRQLKKLKVDECKSMKEILANDGVGEDASIPVIVFSQLQHLELSDLISLEWFCSRNCTVKVPLLETSALVVNWCSLKLKISSDKTLEEVDSNMHLNVQKSHSRKEEEGKPFQFQAESGSQFHSPHISKLEAEIRHLQAEIRAKEVELRDKEQKLAELRDLQQLILKEAN